MRVHHLDCGTLRPRGVKIFADADRIVCHCLLVESSSGLVLVDSGIGIDDRRHPYARLGTALSVILRPELDEEGTAARQIVRLGYALDDVRHIVLTHLDFDHAGGLPDFPRAQIHVHAPEHAAAMARKTLNERLRYKPHPWAHGPTWVMHEANGEHWFGFDAVRALTAHEDEILLVPLGGHTRGHAGVAVKSDGGWLLHSGDAYLFREEMSREPWAPIAIEMFERLIAIDNRARVKNQARLRELALDKKSELRVFCAHDAIELAGFGS